MMAEHEHRWVTAVGPLDTSESVKGEIDYSLPDAWSSWGHAVYIPARYVFCADCGVKATEVHDGD